jgi:7-cyano-7-deazaguanine reductase
MIDNTNVSKVLGQRVDAPSLYDKSILVREPRQSNRTYLNINDNHLPFEGVDVWNNWEISALTDGGLPVTGIAKIIYPCNSKYIVESKSAKLYFNSYNMTKIACNPKSVFLKIEEMSSRDLSEYLETNVQVKIFPAIEESVKNTFYRHSLNESYLNSFMTIDTLYPNLVTDTYNEDDTLLKEDTSKLHVATNQKFRSSLLRSNCRVTHQPDAGYVYIDITSTKTIDTESLLKYIISFRNECHFHEEICECIYTKIDKIFQPSELLVACFYVRRGSLDINPVRCSDIKMVPEFLTDINTPWVKSLRQ